MDTELNNPGMEDVDHLAALLLKQLRHEITETELQYLENWKASHPSHALVSGQVNDGEQLLNDLLAMKQVDMEGWWQKISEQVTIVKKPVPLYRRWYTYAAAAVMLLIAGAITWPYLTPKKLPTPVVENTPANTDILPGGNRAMLTLSDGAVINLGTAANGTLAQEGNANVIKLKDGELKYEHTGNATNGAVWNTLTTPRGGQYSLVLPDGSKVWLNAASSIKYPTNFSAAERRVAITGEVYFEVSPLPAAPNRGGKKVPFIVDVLPATANRGAEVKVLGTQFNIMAYNDEDAIKTTLIKGKIKVSVPSTAPGEANNFKLLAPGQQALIPQLAKSVATTDLIKVVNVEDLEDALAWKNGFISLNHSDIKYIMRTVSRWYNVEVSYQGKIPDYKFTGYIPRSEKISSVLKTLEYGGVHFKLEKNKLSVLP
jgi:ferric-dicitrate binding protein FerR (iron transport regulator)